MLPRYSLHQAVHDHILFDSNSKFQANIGRYYKFKSLLMKNQRSYIPAESIKGDLSQTKSDIFNKL